MKKAIFGIMGALVVLLSACNSESFKHTKSGLMYKIISDEKNPVVKVGQVLKFEFVQKVRDSILFSSVDNGPAYVPVDSSVAADYNPTEIFHLLRKGDSAVIVIEADTLRKRQGGLPPFLKAKDKIFLTIKVTDVFANQEASDKDRMATMEIYRQKEELAAEGQKQKDLVTLNEYLKSKNITAQSAPKGTLVEIIEPGTGLACDSGMWVSVMYTGKTLAGKEFDSNTDPKFNHAGQPFIFQIGSRGAITGWDDGLRLFKKGGKGRLYIPSSLGYGKQGAGEDIKPNENLVFDVQVVEVTDKKPEAPQAAGGH